MTHVAWRLKDGRYQLIKNGPNSKTRLAATWARSLKAKVAGMKMGMAPMPMALQACPAVIVTRVATSTILVEEPIGGVLQRAVPGVPGIATCSATMTI